MNEDIAFLDWAEKLDSGTNHWLPAYGFQQPSHIQEVLLQERNSDNINDGESSTLMLFAEFRAKAAELHYSVVKFHPAKYSFTPERLQLFLEHFWGNSGPDCRKIPKM